MATFWLRASRVEALLGLGKFTEAEAERIALTAAAPESWMAKSMNTQMTALRKLLEVSPRRQLRARHDGVRTRIGGVQTRQRHEPVGRGRPREPGGRFSSLAAGYWK